MHVTSLPLSSCGVAAWVIRDAKHFVATRKASGVANPATVHLAEFLLDQFWQIEENRQF